MTKLFTGAIQALWRYKWLVLPLYGVHLIYGLLVGGEVRTTIEQTLGHSHLRSALQSGYQSNVMADMIRHQELDLGVLLSYVGYGLIGILLLSVWVQSGVIATIAKGARARQVFALGSRFFFKYLGVSIMGLVLLIAIWLLIWTPYLAYSQFKDLGFLTVYHSEKPFFIGLVVVVVLSYFVAVIVSGWTTAVRGNIATQKPASLYKEAVHVLSKSVLLAVFSILLVAIAGVFTYLFTGLVGLCDASSWVGLTAKILVGQYLVITYCKLRIMWYGGVLSILN